MKIWPKILGISLLTFCFFFIALYAKNNQNFYIRVLLNQIPTTIPKTFKIKSKKGFDIQSSKKPKSKIKTKAKELRIKFIQNGLYLSLDNKTYRRTKKNEIDIKPTSQLLKLNNIPYKGQLKFKITNNKELFIINTLDLEEYIYSVIRYESYQAWPKDMHKIQAIASRSYAAHCIGQARNKKNPDSYDIKRSNFHQTYNGTHEYKHLKDATNETKGIVLTHNHKPIVAMFDACCGGAIPAKMKNPDFGKAPYLARTTRCTFCKNYSLYKWKRELTLDQILSKLKRNPKTKKKAYSIGKLRNIKITKKDKAGIVHRIKLFGSKRNIFIRGQDFWQSTNDKIRSLSFSIKKNKNKIIFNGNGFGHQIGLCQRGAREMIRQKWNYKNILRFYYPKTKFAKLKKIFRKQNA